MKTYDVKLERTVTETATIQVAAKDKRTAAFAAATQPIEWQKGEQSPLKIVGIDVAPQPTLPGTTSEPEAGPVAATSEEYSGVIGIDAAKPKKTARSV